MAPNSLQARLHTSPHLSRCLPLHLQGRRIGKHMLLSFKHPHIGPVNLKDNTLENQFRPPWNLTLITSNNTPGFKFSAISSMNTHLRRMREIQLQNSNCKKCFNRTCSDKTHAKIKSTTTWRGYNVAPS